jgi:hypothetical protein
MSRRGLTDRLAKSGGIPSQVQPPQAFNPRRAGRPQSEESHAALPHASLRRSMRQHSDVTGIMIPDRLFPNRALVADATPPRYSLRAKGSLESHADGRWSAAWGSYPWHVLCGLLSRPSSITSPIVGIVGRGLTRSRPFGLTRLRVGPCCDRQRNGLSVCPVSPESGHMSAAQDGPG